MAGDQIELSGTVSAAGTARLSLRPTNRQQWTVKQISTFAPNVGVAAIAQIFINGAFVTEIVATNGVAADEPYLELSSSETVTVQWTGATVGAQVKATFFYDDGN